MSQDRQCDACHEPLSLESALWVCIECSWLPDKLDYLCKPCYLGIVHAATAALSALVLVIE